MKIAQKIKNKSLLLKKYTNSAIVKSRNKERGSLIKNNRNETRYSDRVKK